MADDLELDPEKELTKPKFNKGDGVAVCAAFTGYGANNMGADAIMFKSAQEASETQLRKLFREVRVTLSFEEFLRKFFDVWGDSAQVLSEVLGYETEYPEWYSDTDKDRIKDKVEQIELLKTLKTEEDFLKLDNEKQDAVTAIQVKFEKALRSGAFSGSKTEEKPSDINNNSENGENLNMSTEKTEDLIKQMKDMQDLLKAEQDARVAAEEKADGIEKDALLAKATFQWLTEEDTTLLKAKDIDTITSVVTLLNKANEKIVALEADLEKAKTEKDESDPMRKSLSVDGEADEGKKDSGLIDMLKSMNQYVQ